MRMNSWRKLCNSYKKLVRILVDQCRWLYWWCRIQPSTICIIVSHPTFTFSGGTESFAEESCSAMPNLVLTHLPDQIISRHFHCHIQVSFLAFLCDASIKKDFEEEIDAQHALVSTVCFLFTFCQCTIAFGPDFELTNLQGRCYMGIFPVEGHKQLSFPMHSHVFHFCLADRIRVA